MIADYIYFQHIAHRIFLDHLVFVINYLFYPTSLLTDPRVLLLVYHQDIDIKKGAFIEEDAQQQFLL